MSDQKMTTTEQAQFDELVSVYKSAPRKAQKFMEEFVLLDDAWEKANREARKFFVEQKFPEIASVFAAVADDKFSQERDQS